MPTTLETPLRRQCRCLVCGHIWITQLEGRDPRQCPGCMTWRWNIDPKVLPLQLRKKRPRKRKS